MESFRPVTGIPNTGHSTEKAHKRTNFASKHQLRWTSHSPSSAWPSVTHSVTYIGILKWVIHYLPSISALHSTGCSLGPRWSLEWDTFLPHFLHSYRLTGYSSCIPAWSSPGSVLQHTELDRKASAHPPFTTPKLHKATNRRFKHTLKIYLITVSRVQSDYNFHFNSSYNVQMIFPPVYPAQTMGIDSYFTILFIFHQQLNFPCTQLRTLEVVKRFRFTKTKARNVYFWKATGVKF